VSVFLLYLSFVYAAIEINFSMNEVDYNKCRTKAVCVMHPAAKTMVARLWLNNNLVCDWLCR